MGAHSQLTFAASPRLKPYGLRADNPEQGNRDRSDETAMSASVTDWSGLEEAERVYYWRLCRLLDLGYGMPEAEEIASADVDLHALERLVVVGGCEPKLAASILS
jgi:hypothetical protein